MNIEVDILNKMAADINLILGKLNKVEYTLREIDTDLHQVKPAYLQKLRLFTECEDFLTHNSGVFST